MMNPSTQRKIACMRNCNCMMVAMYLLWTSPQHTICMLACMSKKAKSSWYRWLSPHHRSTLSLELRVLALSAAVLESSCMLQKHHA